MNEMFNNDLTPVECGLLAIGPNTCKFLVCIEFDIVHEFGFKTKKYSFNLQ